MAVLAGKGWFEGWFLLFVCFGLWKVSLLETGIAQAGLELTM